MEEFNVLCRIIVKGQSMSEEIEKAIREYVLKT